MNQEYQEYNENSKEATVADLIGRLGRIFRLCVKANMDKSTDSAFIWQATYVNRADEISLQELFDALYDADPKQFETNAQTVLRNIKAGPGLRDLLESWVVSKLADVGPKPLYPELN